MKKFTFILGCLIFSSFSQATIIQFDLESSDYLTVYSYDSDGNFTDSGDTVDIGSFSTSLTLGTPSSTYDHNGVNYDGDGNAYYNSAIYLMDTISDASSSPSFDYLRSLDIFGVSTEIVYAGAELSQNYTDYVVPDFSDNGQEYLLFNVQHSAYFEQQTSQGTLQTQVDFNQQYFIYSDVISAADELSELTESDFWNALFNSVSSSVWLNESYGVSQYLCDDSGNCSSAGSTHYSIDAYGYVSQVEPTNVPEPSALLLFLLPACLWFRRLKSSV